MKTKTRKYGKDTLIRKLDKLHKDDEDMKALSKHLEKKGFKPKKNKKNYWGVKGTHTHEGKTGYSYFYIQDYHKSKSKDVAAIARCETELEGRRKTYSFYLIAPEGNFKKVKEFRVGKGRKVLKTECFWSCIGDYFYNNAVDTVIKAFEYCALTSWWLVLYFSCLGAAALGTFIRACACCNCNNDPSCNWFWGICRQ